MNQQHAFSLQKMMGFYVNRTAYLMSEGIAQRFTQHGFAISAQDFGILNLLWQADGLTHSHIAEKMLRDKTTITRRIDGMVKKGLLRREVDPQNRRNIRVYLTPQSQACKATLIQILRDFHAEVLAGITPEDVTTTMQTLEKIINNRLEHKS